MADYITAEEMAGFAHEPGALASSGLLLTAASRFFDNACEVGEDFFAPAASPAAYTGRVFVGDGTAYLRLDPYTALDPVDPVTIDPEHVYDVPEYAEIDGALVVLDRTKQSRPEAAFYPNRYTGWRDGVKVTVSANWGFAETPADVKLAVAHIALHLWRTADPAFAVVSNSEGAAGRPLTLPAIAQGIVDRYRQKYSRRFIFA